MKPATTTAMLPILLTVHDSNGREIQRRRLDFLRPDDRRNIAATAWWAMHNGYTLTTKPEK